MPCNSIFLLIIFHKKSVYLDNMSQQSSNVLIFYSTVSAIEWDSYTTDMLCEADKILVHGRPLRQYFDKCLSRIIENLKAQSDAVNKAIRLRVEEYQEVIKKLNNQKAEVRIVL